MYYRGITSRGTKHWHRGIDLMAPTGTPVVAAEGGVVEFAERKHRPGFSGYGKVVVVKDTRGFHYLYAHLDEVDVSKGQRVTRGQQIGTVGITAFTRGNPTGMLRSRNPHLHFEVSDKRYPKPAEADRLDPVDHLARLAKGPAGKGAGALLVMALAGAGLWWYTQHGRKPWRH
jgi:murein DD-endopeptidase MepM/ murein hydrolase activator NlpD